MLNKVMRLGLQRVKCTQPQLRKDSQKHTGVNCMSTMAAVASWAEGVSCLRKIICYTNGGKRFPPELKCHSTSKGKKKNVREKKMKKSL